MTGERCHGHWCARRRNCTRAQGELSSFPAHLQHACTTLPHHSPSSSPSPAGGGATPSGSRCSWSSAGGRGPASSPLLGSAGRWCRRTAAAGRQQLPSEHGPCRQATVHTIQGRQHRPPTAGSASSSGAHPGSGRGSGRRAGWGGCPAPAGAAGPAAPAPQSRGLRCGAVAMSAMWCDGAVCGALQARVGWRGARPTTGRTCMGMHAGRPQLQRRVRHKATVRP